MKTQRALIIGGGIGFRTRGKQPGSTIPSGILHQNYYSYAQFTFGNDTAFVSFSDLKFTRLIMAKLCSCRKCP
jgi:hypothetical protein